MEFSVGSWSFHRLFESGKMNIFGYIETMKYRYHLNSLDVWSGMVESTDEDYVKKLKTTLSEEGMTAACLAADVQIWHPNQEMRELNRHTIAAYIEMARSLNAKVLRLDAGIQSYEVTDEQLDFVSREYQTYAQIGQEYGFSVGPQTHQPAMQVPSNVKRLVEAVGSPAFGVIVDVARWIEDIETGDEMAAKHAVLLHFDSSRTKTRADLERKVNLFLQCGYKGCWSLEYRLEGSEYLGVARDLAELRRAVDLMQH